LPPPRSSRHDDDRDRDRDDDFDDDPRPRRRRRSRRDPDSDLEPHRGGLVMAFGIVSIVLVLLSGGLVVGLVLGILAWMWGASDLKRMDDGYMDPSGRGNTHAGYVCGIIGTMLNIVALVVGLIILIIYGGFCLSYCCCMFGASSAAGPPPRSPGPSPGRR